MNKKWRKAIAVVLSFAMVAGTFAGDFVAKQKTVEAAPSGEPIRVDINDSSTNRPLAYSETFTNWHVNSGKSASTTIDDVTFTLSNGGTTGTGIKGAMYRLMLREGDTTSPRLTCDGALVTFNDGDDQTGGTIKLEISGLSAGKHTLKTWHSFFDKVEGSSMTLSIDGKDVETIENITRAYTDDDATITFNEFEVEEGKTVTVIVRPNGDGTYNNAVLNAFAIDDVASKSQVINPYPANGERHFQPEEGFYWTAGKGAISHDVYFGTDYDAVENATKDSPEFKGNQVATSYAVDTDLSHMDTYYWRVDEVTEDGTDKGDVMAFEVVHQAFPSAEGYGRFAKGGRGGRVIEVTNLNDSGPGSLRQAIEVEKGPRIIVFRVGGVIRLESKLTIPDDGGDVYIAGQTAPGDGITVIQDAFGMYYTEDVIMRHIRVRVGDVNGKSTDGIGMAGCNHCIVDHCSISWTTDEGTSSRYAENITFQYNLIAEALNNSVHYDADDRENTERHSFAGSIGGDVGSYHHNLLVNCTGRNWSLAGGIASDSAHYYGNVDIRNNVVYNFRDRTTDGGARRVNFVNNYYKKGAVSKDMKIFTIDGNELGYDDMQMAYLSGNMLVEKNGEVILAANQNAWDAGKAASAKKNSTTADVRSDVPFFPSYVETETAEDAYTTVLGSAGATVPKRDYLDTRYVKETTEGSFTYKGSKDKLEGIIDSQEDVDGYPDTNDFNGGTRILKDDDHDGMPNNWEEAYGLNPNNAEDRNGLNLSADGYTNLEMYLNELAGDEVNYADDKEVTVSFDDKYYEDIKIVIPSADPTPTPEASPEVSAGPSSEPEVSKTPAVSEEAEASKEPATSEEAGASKEPVTSEEAEASKTPATSEEAGASKEPATSEEVEASKEPATSEETVASKEPVTSEETVASKKPVTSEETVASKKPVTSEETVASKEPVTSEEAGASKEPVSSPEVSENVLTTAAPDITPSTTPSDNPNQKPGDDPSPQPGPGPSANPPSKDPEVILGDTDDNKDVQLDDAQQVLKAALMIVNLDPMQIKAADVNKDGQVTLEDAQMVLKYALRIINSWE